VLQLGVVSYASPRQKSDVRSPMSEVNSFYIADLRLGFGTSDKKSRPRRDD